MATYGTKEYWEDERDRASIVLDSLIWTGFDNNTPYKKTYNFCKIFVEHYEDYVNAIEHIKQLEATNECKSDA